MLACAKADCGCWPDSLLLQALGLASMRRLNVGGAKVGQPLVGKAQVLARSVAVSELEHCGDLIGQQHCVGEVAQCVRCNGDSTKLRSLRVIVPRE